MYRIKLAGERNGLFGSMVRVAGMVATGSESLPRKTGAGGNPSRSAVVSKTMPCAGRLAYANSRLGEVVFSTRASRCASAIAKRIIATDPAIPPLVNASCFTFELSIRSDPSSYLANAGCFIPTRNVSEGDIAIPSLRFRVLVSCYQLAARRAAGV